MDVNISEVSYWILTFTEYTITDTGGLSFLSQVEAEAGSYSLFCVHESQCAKYICNIQVYS